MSRKNLQIAIRVELANDLNSKMKGVRLAFSSFEVRLMDERERKNAEMAPFNSNFGELSRTFLEQHNKVIGYICSHSEPALFTLMLTPEEVVKTLKTQPKYIL